MVKNGICFGGESKQNALFLEDVPCGDAPMPSVYGMGPDQWRIQNSGEHLRWSFFAEIINGYTFTCGESRY